MDGNTTIIVISVVVNVSVVAYSYGRLSQTVKDLCRRVGRVENILNGKETPKEVK